MDKCAVAGEGWGRNTHFVEQVVPHVLQAGWMGEANKANRGVSGRHNIANPLLGGLEVMGYCRIVRNHEEAKTG
jgi:hypothetical protein